MDFECISLRKQIGLALFRQYTKAETQKHTLRYLMWECTLRCNFHCLHCGSDCKKDSSVKDMPVADFLRVIDEIAPTVKSEETMIVITGGEPLLRNDLERVGKEFFARHFPWGMVTNGYLLTKEKLNGLIASGIHSITISLDGFKDSHEWLRGIGGAYDKATNAIQMVAKTNLTFDVVTCVNQHNFEELDQLREQLVRWNVKKWRLFTIFPIGRAQENPMLNLTKEQFKSFFLKIKAWRQTGEIKVNYGCEGFLGNLETEVRDQFFFCRAGINIASILADGSVTGCTNINHHYIQGNIYKNSFTEIWENRFKVMRERSWLKSGECADCRHFKNCKGNGFHLHDENGKLMFCHLHKITANER